MKRVRRILLPSDFADSAATAGEFAADLALRYDAGIDVVHVFKGAQDIEPFVDWLELDDTSEGRSSVMGDFLRHHAKPRLTAVLQKLVEFGVPQVRGRLLAGKDRKSTRLNSSLSQISYAVFCLKKKKKPQMFYFPAATSNLWQPLVLLAADTARP